ncbi:ABC transporter permease [Ensifer soli]|uniref:ABC transporter permease n=1 Tax=Ciceribacter sp. sgz301302 TaxID=3342379 RepID=UPI0035B96800
MSATAVTVRPPLSERAGAAFAGIAGFAMLALIYLPVLWLALMSVSGDPLSGIPRDFTLEWYGKLFADGRWIAPLASSIWLGVAVGISCALASIVVARVIPVLKQRGLVLGAFLFPLFVPGILVGVAIFLYFRVILGLRLGWWSMFFGHFTWAYPFSLLALLVNTLRFDTRLLEAAGDLGATRWQAFRDVEFPLILPGIVSATMFGFLLSFNDLAHSLLLKGSVQTLPLYEWVQASSHNSNVPILFSLSTLIMLASMTLVGSAFLLLFGKSKD